MNSSNTFSRVGQNTLYGTSNQEYGSPWAQDNTRPEQLNIKTARIPTYTEIVGSMNDFRKAERLIKSKIVQEKLQEKGISLNHENNKYDKKTTFHATAEGYRYPEHGLNVGPAIYHTNNMNYGRSSPASFEIQDKYFPCNSTFTKEFNGGNVRFNGLNTVKTVSQVHNGLNDF